MRAYNRRARRFLNLLEDSDGNTRKVSDISRSFGGDLEDID